MSKGIPEKTREDVQYVIDTARSHGYPKKSQREVARSMGMPHTTLQMYLHKLADKFNIDPRTGLQIEQVQQARPDRSLKIMVIPDTQVKPGIDMAHLIAAGKYAAAKKPDIIVQIGDFADMESLSSYDIGKKSFEGRTYKADIAAAHLGMKLLTQPIRDEMKRTGWSPEMILTLGNHEDRISRAIELDRKLEGTISLDDLAYEKFGWTVYPFLEPIERGGVMFAHYFVTGVMGRAAGTATAILNKKHQSCVAGHQQGRQVAYATRANGASLCCIIAGSYYTHIEAYLGAQGNKHWRGIVMLHEVADGSFDEMFVSLDYLVKRVARKG